MDLVRLPLRINRYIMECKFCSFSIQDYDRPELIDTLWNVNNTVYPASFKPSLN